MKTALAIASSLLLVSSLAFAEPRPMPPALAQAVKDLGADRLETRVAARDLLWKAGSAALVALEAAAKSDDLEVALTARHLLDRLELGLSPEMLAELIHAAEAFRFGSEAEKVKALPVLVRHQVPVLLSRLASLEPPGRLRTQALEAAWKARFPLMRQWLAKSDYASVEKFLKEVSSATGDNWDYAAYLTLRGQADDQIKALQTAPTKPSSDLKLLAQLLRLKGDLPAALKAAQQAGNENLARDLLVELGDWQQVRSLSVPTMIRGKSAWLASVYRLAGDKNGSEEQIKVLKLEAQTQPQASAFHALEINDHTADAIDLWSSSKTSQKMADLAVQGRMIEALACVGIDRSQSSYLAWLKNFYPQLEAGKIDGDAWEKKPQAHPEQISYNLALQAAVILASLGEQEPAVELVDKLAAATGPDDKHNQIELYKTYRRIGSQQQTCVHGARVLALSKNSEGFNLLYTRGEDWQLVRFWWDYLGRDGQAPPPEARLQSADELARTSSGRRPRAPKPAMEFVRKVEAWVRGQPESSQRTNRLLQLSQACLRYDYKPLAIEYLARAATDSRSSAINLHLGFLLFGQQQWSAAAERFGLAFEQDPSQIRALYLKGCALVRNGQQAAGESEIRLARLTLLADVGRHSELAKHLYAVGLYREAADEWQQCMRFSGCTSADTFNANHGLGNTASLTKDFAGAARLWDRCTLTIAEFMIAEPGAVIRFSDLIHRTRARGLIESGEVDRALAEATLGFEAVPGDVDLPITLVPMLEAAGRNQAAEQLFDRTFQFYQRILRQFPKSSYHLNSSAWLAAICHRRLDEVLPMAQQAVALEPDRWAYTDTLAEVFFQLGDRNQALTWAAKSNELEPDDQLQQKRLDHFRNDALPRAEKGGEVKEKLTTEDG